MSGEIETHQNREDDSGSESGVEEEEIQTVSVDPTKLTPLSPEVISKQVSILVPLIGLLSYFVADNCSRLQ